MTTNDTPNAPPPRDGPMALRPSAFAPVRSLKWPAMSIVIAAVGLIAYYNTLTVPFHFDDVESIVNNAGIRSLSNLRAVLWPPPQMSVSGRPIVHFSLAVNYALSGLNAGGYHVVNLLIHLCASLALFGVVRRTLATGPMVGRFGHHADWLAFAVALLWVAHPLQTMSVTYIIQRAESLTALFYLLTIYCMLRGATGGAAFRWYALSFACCAAGMGCKEVMVTAPVAVLLYDRVFLAGGFREALYRRRGLYAALAMTWVLLVAFNWSAPRSASAGLSLRHVSPAAYLVTQPEVILHYLRMAFWPRPLCIDYDWPLATNFAHVAQPALAVLVMLVASVWLMVRGRPLGFAGVIFFLILAPSSSLVPVIIVASEHRMYLPLAAVILVVVLGLYDIVMPRVAPAAPRAAIGLALFSAATIGLVMMTIQRNETYRSELSLWTDTVAQRPNNPRAVNSLGFALSHAGRYPDAIRCYRRALELRPDYDDARFNLAEDLAKIGQRNEAEAQYRAVLSHTDKDDQAHAGLGAIQTAKGDLAGAANSFRRALNIRAENPRALRGLGLVLANLGQFDEAFGLLSKAVAMDPYDATLRYQCGVALAAGGRFEEAAANFDVLVRQQPNNVDARYRLALSLSSAGRPAEALAHFQQALSSMDSNAEAHTEYATALSRTGRAERALAEYRRAMELDPAQLDAKMGAAWILATSSDEKLRNVSDALSLAEAVCHGTGNKNIAALDTLAAAYANAGRFDDAARTAAQSVALAQQANQNDMVKTIDERLELYRRKQPYRK